MTSIVMIEGNVAYNITLDPAVWIFDDRRINLKSFFSSNKEEDKSEGNVTNVSKQWEREISEGAISPPTLQTEKKFEKEKVLTGSFGILLKHFLENAQPLQNATALDIVTHTETITISLSQAADAILAFSNNGEPLKDNGPIHIYFADGSNKESPITHIRKFIVK
ncbi:peptidyl-prolyl cis-trans isomerase [Bacillus sp. SM2101]|uniref:peptidyl-prolyl cis-trans isomerase n=1 Tax=Bacillus sp. SM2101 TaxID=2805366 RepID=UPI001BDE1BF9